MSEEVKEEVSHLLYDQPEPELRQVALGIVDGSIFCDRQIMDPALIPSVFMLLMLLDEKDAKELRARDPGMIYEYMREAGPQAINGYPIFFSFWMLSRNDTAKVLGFIKELQAQRQAFLAAK